MRGVNKVIIVGTLGNDPEVKQFPNGGSITTISVATSEQWNDKQTGEKREATEWHRIQFNNKLAEIAAQYLRKGSKVYIEGKLKTRKYQDNTGQDRYVTEINAFEMQMLGDKGDNQQNTSYPMQNNQNYQQPQDNSNPFMQNQPNDYAQNMANQAQANFGNGQAFNNQTTGNAPPPSQINDQDVPF